ncbi:PREDICTED: alkaline phosphatase, tissue-nonspecific isozyme-like [Priapulus caudatus]|uniref:alkaline phosphatase n=1 Tax=Priapulus caudatus TaxID=37621 RepID=A0ABM1DW50_PRICU|nr:PREDICTED: alkaline phosphatase, tissue-nonspecific isozyme-like [Priapulus caudatus]
MGFHLDNLALPESSRKEPTLTEMTEKAIKILQKNQEQGFFLLVESSNIDKGHHAGVAAKSLYETLQLDEAVTLALTLTDADDTLIIVTADHSHAMSMVGYPSRGNPILGKVEEPSDVDFLPFTTLLYAISPGASVNASREDITSVDTSGADYRQQAAVPRSKSPHAGEDVAVYAHGTMSHLFRGVYEQTYVAHAAAFAACIGTHTDYNSEHCRQAHAAAGAPLLLPSDSMSAFVYVIVRVYVSALLVFFF